MSFKPVGDRHAIMEVVFQLVFAREFQAGELKKFAEAHNDWKSDLPKIERMTVFQFAIGPESGPPPDQPEPAAPVLFKSFKRDGGLDWQLAAQNNWTAVNCLAYSRWAAVSKQAKGLLAQALTHLASADNPLTSISLQYVDKFRWDGNPEDYRVNDLLNRDSGFFPKSFDPKFPAWHHHTGQFSFHEDAKTPHRILERIHLDAAFEQEIPIVKIDTVMRVDLKKPIASSDPEIGNLVDEFFETLHLKNKRLLSEVINEESKEAISLFGKPENAS
ncbi:MAG: hypothetical protein COA41_15385 [Sphingopyxis sp.]|nr:MAG: hypothetical protein COA41_15385 [Sphingopyxis sp.]